MKWAVVDQNGHCLVDGCGAPVGLGRAFADGFAESERDRLREALREALRDGARRTLTLSRRGMPASVEVLPLAQQDGKREQALAVMRWDTDLDGSQQHALRLAQRNEAILRSSMDGFFVVGEDFRFIEVNEAFCRMTGYSAPELRLMKISDLEVTDAAEAFLPEHMQTGLHHFPTAHRHKDGHLIYLEISVNVLYDDGLKILVGFARDVTDRRRAEQEFARLSRRHKLILDSAVEGIYGVDRDGLTTFVNPAAARILAASAGTLLGRPVHTLFDGSTHLADECQDAECPICAVLRTGIPRVQTETRFRRSDGTKLPVEYSITPMYEDGQVVGAVVMFRDITQQKQAEEQRRALESQIIQTQKLESLGLLAGGIAHDLNNTLVGVLGNACMAIGQLPDVSGVRERLQRIVGACERASKVIRQILAYSGQVSCEAVPLDLNEVIRDLTDFMRAAVRNTIELHLELDENLPAVRADEGQMHQVVTNLIVNASEAIGERPGRITVTTDAVELTPAASARDYPGLNLEEGAYVRLRVQDTGRGIAADVLPRVFDPFFSDKGAGRGMGLSVMHGIVRAHEGGVRVDSKPGAGACFTLIFPAVQETAAQGRPARARPNACGGKTALVVDDEPDVREITRDILEDQGMRVLTAQNGHEALETFGQQPHEIDVVLLDWTMPGLSGGEVYRRLTAIRPDVPVIVASGYAEESVVSHFGSQRPAGFVHKPFTIDGLLECIGDALRARSSA